MNKYDYAIKILKNEISKMKSKLSYIEAYFSRGYEKTYKEQIA